jgi:biopolymer transport protein ExbB
MASGISKATVPTMAGMIAALSGLFFVNQLDHKAKLAVQKLEDNLKHG